MTRSDFFNQRDSCIIYVFRIDGCFVTVGAKTKCEGVIIVDNVGYQVEVYFSDKGLSPEEFSLSTVTMTDVINGKVVQNMVDGVIHPGR